MKYGPRKSVDGVIARIATAPPHCLLLATRNTLRKRVAKVGKSTMIGMNKVVSEVGKLIKGFTQGKLCEIREFTYNVAGGRGLSKKLPGRNIQERKTEKQRN